MIYFDSTATTKPLKEVLDTYNKINEEYWYNPSGMYNGSVVVSNLIEKATKQIESTLKLNNKNISRNFSFWRLFLFFLNYILISVFHNLTICKES